MVRRLKAEHKASIYAKLHTPGLTNNQIAAEEGITPKYVRVLRAKEVKFGTPWPESKAPQNARKLKPAAVAALKDLVARTPDAGQKEQQAFLEEEFGITVSYETIRRHLRSKPVTTQSTAAGREEARPTMSAGQSVATPRITESAQQPGMATTTTPPSRQPRQRAAQRQLPSGPRLRQSSCHAEARLVPITDRPQSTTPIPLPALPGVTQPLQPVRVHTERTLHGVQYLASNDASLVSHDFVLSAYADKTSGGGGMYWTSPLHPQTVQLMLSNSSVMAIYRVLLPEQISSSSSSSRNIQPGQLQQVGMARFVTDYVTHAYLTDVYVAPAWRGRGLGTWLVECCDEFVSGMPGLRKLMLCTSDPGRNAGFYARKLGMEVPPQDPERHLIMVRTGRGGGRRFEADERGSL